MDYYSIQVLQIGSCIGRLPVPIGKRQAGKLTRNVPMFLSQDRIQELGNLTGRAFRYTRDQGNLHKNILKTSHALQLENLSLF